MVDVHLERDGIVIRSAKDADAEQLNAWWNDGEVMAHAGFPLGLGQSIEETREQIARNLVERDQRLIIEYQRSPIGEMNYRFLEDRCAEIGIKLCVPTSQNQGLGTVALKLLITFLFGKEGLASIQLDTNLKNERAQHVYERIGFTRLRVNRDAWRDQLGELQSSVDYVLTRDSWESRSSEW